MLDAAIVEPDGELARRDFGLDDALEPLPDDAGADGHSLRRRLRRVDDPGPLVSAARDDALGDDATSAPSTDGDYGEAAVVSVRRRFVVYCLL